MELYIPLKTPFQISTVIICLLLIGSSATVRAEKDLHLLMVTDKSNEISPLNTQELRKLFLGVPIYRNNHQLKPMINRGDEMCYQIFLQYILGMSHKRYVRTMVSSLYRNGIKSPPVFIDIDDVAGYLREEPYSITYIYKHNLPKFDNIKVIQEIWVSRAP
ncbi:hypothetical protein MNBD_GAMMA09-2970 [hydrothermal vent metagenome]|uniref:Uncharacterized protein n=1 Tax=hydrothermal vent metagenome TaxID=652676 RepID=A0A3B0XMT0_9ZZZZ